MDTKKLGKTILEGQFIFVSEDKVVCKYCKDEFKYHRSNSSLSYHLRNKHAFIVRDNKSSTSSSSNSAEIKLRQSTLIDVQERAKPMAQKQYDSITNAIAHWIALNGRPINIVTVDGLQDVIRIASGNQSYSLPSRPVIDERISNLYEQERDNIQAKLNNAVYVALTADYWSSLANDSYLGVTGHILDNSWKLQAFVLAVYHVEDRHYAQACADHLSSVANAWKIYDRVTTLGTDNARNMTSAVNLLPFEHMPCIAHSLQLSVKAGLTESGIDNILDKSRKIVGHFKHSPANSVELKGHQERLKLSKQALMQDVITRWNSTLQMIERLLVNREAIVATLTDPEHKHKLTLLTDAEWEKLRLLQTLRDPCRYATMLLGGETYVSCSVILPTICHLLRIMTVSEDDPGYVVRFKTAFSTDLENRKQNCNLSWLKIATALDPRFKLLKCLPKDQRDDVWGAIQRMIAEAQDSLSDRCTEPPAKRSRMCEYSSDSDDEPLRPQTDFAALKRYTEPNHRLRWNHVL